MATKNALRPAHGQGTVGNQMVRVGPRRSPSLGSEHAATIAETAWSGIGETAGIRPGVVIPKA
jgi:hypothetical protein